MNRINGLNSTPSALNKFSGKTAEPGFSQRLTDAIKEVNSKQNTADDSMQKVVKGKMGVQEGMLALQEADLSMKLLLKVRAKVVQAYQEIIKMPV